MNDLCQNYNERASTLVGYIDFQKAFDKVSVPKLLYKIDILGIGGKLKSCLESFLSGRSQRVKVAGFLSEPKFISSGVPQGRVQRPILFVICINDLPTIIHQTIKSKILLMILSATKKLCLITIWIFSSNLW